MKSAIVAGASGLVGSQLLADLLECRDYDRVIALVRSPLKIESAKLVQEKVDFASLDQLRASADGADLFCTLGTTIKKAGSQEAFRAVDHDAVIGFAAWGKGQGAARFFLVSALGADPASSVFYNRVKGEVERDLQALGFAQIAIFRPSLLLGPRAEVRPGELIASAASKPLRILLRGPLAKYRPIQSAAVAAAMLKAAESRKEGIQIYESNEIEALAQS